MKLINWMKEWVRPGCFGFSFFLVGYGPAPAPWLRRKERTKPRKQPQSKESEIHERQSKWAIQESNEWKELLNELWMLLALAGMNGTAHQGAPPRGKAKQRPMKQQTNCCGVGWFAARGGCSISFHQKQKQNKFSFSFFFMKCNGMNKKVL